MFRYLNIWNVNLHLYLLPRPPSVNNEPEAPTPTELMSLMEVQHCIVIICSQFFCYPLTDDLLKGRDFFSFVAHVPRTIPNT